MIAVVPPMRGQVEGDRQAHLTGREVAAVEGVGLLGGREAGVLADRPRPVGVHRRPHAADERLEAGERVEVVDVVEVGRGVERLAPMPSGVCRRQRRRGRCP